MDSFLFIVGLGFCAGILTGIMGVGGGVVLVPMMVLLLAVPQHLAQGISMLVIIPTVIVAIIKLRQANLFQYRMALLLAAGSIIGSLLSSNLVQLIDGVVLKKIFGALVIYSSIRMILPAKKTSKS
jgi:uncharacterized membrane protein YfcA